MKKSTLRYALITCMMSQNPAFSQLSIGDGTGADDGIINGINDTNVVANSYIIKFSRAHLMTYNPEIKGGPTYKEFMIESAENLANEYGGELKAVYHNTIQGFLMHSRSRVSVESMNRDQRVANIHADKYTTSFNTQTNPTWGLDRIDQTSLPLNQRYDYQLDGTGVTAYVFDTGATNHYDFNGRINESLDFYTGAGGIVACDANGYTPIPGIDPPLQCFSDCNGHGTHVAGTLGGQTWGVAKNVDIQPIRVLGCDGSGKVSDIMNGIDWLIENIETPAVVNMSLGAQNSDPLRDSVQSLINQDIIVVAAAGNSNTNATNISPANVPGVITVAATDINDNRWVEGHGSNYGAVVDLFAPGGSIRSADADSNTGSIVRSGTSMASPHVAGAVALYLQAHPTASLMQVTDAIVGNASSGQVQDAGAGSPNRLLNVSALMGVGPVVEPDEYDDVSIRGYTDDAPGDAEVTYVGTTQQHNFHDEGDEDWIIFALGFNGAVDVVTETLFNSNPGVGAHLAAYRVDGSIVDLGNGRYDIDEAGLTLIGSSQNDHSNAVYINNDVSAIEVFVVKAYTAGGESALSQYELSSINAEGLNIDEYDDITIRGYTDNIPGDSVITYAGQYLSHTIHSTNDVDWSIFAIGPGDMAQFNIGGLSQSTGADLKLERYRLDGDYQEVSAGRWDIELNDLILLETKAFSGHSKNITVHNTSNEIQVYLFKTSYLNQGGEYLSWVEVDF